MSGGKNAREGWERVRETLGLNPRRETSILIFHVQKKGPNPPIYNCRGCPYNFPLVRVN